jgi:hypothetical protein
LSMSAPSRTGAPTPALIRLAMGFQIVTIQHPVLAL